MRKKIQTSILTFLFLIFACACQSKQNVKANSKAVAVTAHYIASDVGVEIMNKGGNAFDAAVAVQFALAVVYPRAGNIGGGGFAVLRTSDGTINSLDFREKAPALAHEKMYQDQKGNVNKKLSQVGHLAVGVPGTVDGMVELHQKYGKLSWADLLQPAIDLASKGVALSELEANKLNDYQERIAAVNPDYRSNPYVKKTLFAKGDTLKNSELAESLQRIQAKGRDGFYKGKTAQLIVREMKKGKGILSFSDLENYHSVWRKPITGTYRDHQIISMPPPSSGGIALLQLLKGAELMQMNRYEYGSFEHIHLMTELERRVYADRATWLGDPDYCDVPIEKLIDEEYLQERFASIDLKRKSDSQEIKAGKVDLIESFETTHFSIVDEEGNAIAITTTLNGNYGCKLVVKGGGFFLNNEMDDFSSKPGVPNQFGLVGGKANAIQANKRMLSSMTPTIVCKDGKLKMLVGSPGGSTIITSVFQNIINYIDFGMSGQEAVNAPRFHSQWLPDELYVEKSFQNKQSMQQLEKAGHQIKRISRLGMMANITFDSEGNAIGNPDKVRHTDAKASSVKCE